MRFGLPELPRGLVESGPVGDVVLVEKLRPSINLDASLDENSGEETGERRADLHEVSFGIALPLDWRRAAGAPQPPAGGGHRRERNRKNDASIHRLDLMQRECIVALSFSANLSKGRTGRMPSEIHDTISFKRGPGGRPTRQEAERRHQNLLASAARLFLAKGWDGASVDEISRQSGVAKRFIYARYPDKAALFIGAVERFIDEKMEILHSFESLPEDVEEGLCAFGRRLLDVALRPDTLAYLRLFISEAPRFPELAMIFVERNRRRGLAEINRVLAAYAGRGAIELSDAEIRAEQFFILVIGQAQRLALLGAREEPAKEDRQLKAAVRLFLDGCRQR